MARSQERRCVWVRLSDVATGDLRFKDPILEGHSAPVPEIPQFRIDFIPSSSKTDIFHYFP